MAVSEPSLILHQQTANEEVRVWQEHDKRCLDFNDGLIQSQIILNHPEILPLPLNSAMLAGVMFVDQPKRVLLAGLGGGATARYFAACFPSVMGDAVEKSELVVDIAQQYFDFPRTDNWQIDRQDIVDYVQDCTVKYDLIIIDIAIEQQTPERLVSRNFLQQCRSLLTENGHISLNLLVEDANAFLHSVAAIREVFDRRTVCLSLPNYRNTIVMAFNNTPIFSANDAQARMAEMESSWGLEFGEFYQQMLKDNPDKSGVF